MAIDQIDGIDADTTKSVSAKIDATKLANADAIILKSGDSAGSAVVAKAITLKAETPVTNHTITLANVQNGYTTPTLSVADGTTYKAALENVTDPTKAKGTSDKLDWKFVGWYTDADLTTKLDKNATVTADVTLYAKFVQVRIVGDVNGDGQIKAADLTLLKRFTGGTLKDSDKTKYSIDSKIDNNRYTYNSKPETNVYVNGDVNGDGNIKAADLTLLKRFTGGTIKDTDIEKYGVGKPLTIIKD